MRRFLLCICNVFCVFSVLALFSCATVRTGTSKQRTVISRNLTASPKCSKEQLVRYFMSENPSANKSYVQQLAGYYIDEAKIEGINSDCAFAQMCLETGYLRFGNLVVPEMNNFCGLGAMNKEHPGEWFESPQIGVRAHIQHLQAYATTEDVALKQALVDPRYSWVHKAKFAKTVYDLAGAWAVDPQYGEKLNAILTKMERVR